MATAKSASELKALQERMAELEKQLTALRTLVGTGRAKPRSARRPWTKEDAKAYNEAAQRVQKIIERNREADRRRAAAEYDRLHGRPKKGSPPAAKPCKPTTKVRRAG
jgi:hypothetical protein